MARGATFGALVQLTRAEARHNTSAAAGINAAEHIKTTIARTYENLLREHDWPHLITRHTITLAAGQYRYAIPATVEAERIFAEDAFAYYSTEEHRYPVSAEEITLHRLNELDPETTAGRLDPVRLWMLIPDDMIEVWPCPATDGGVLNFRGVRAVDRLVAEADVCQLDDRLVSLFAAAELLGPEHGRPKLAQAQSLLVSLKGSLNKRRVFNMVADRAIVEQPGRTRLEVIYTRAV